MAGLKWLGLAVIGALVAIGLSVAAVYVLSETRLNAHVGTPTELVTVPKDVASIQHGQHLAGAIALCTQCHGANLSGGVVLDNAAARVVAPNLTRGGVGASLSDADFARAIRRGVDPSGRPQWIMPSDQYNSMSDADLGALIAYLRSLPATPNTLPSQEMRPLGRALLVAGRFDLLPSAAINQSKPRVPAPAIDATAPYGQYLATMAGCARCHGPGLSGSPVPGSPGNFATNITPAGLGNWSEADFVRVMRTGRRPDTSLLDPSMPWMYYAQMSDLELRAIWEYLGAVPGRATGTR